MEIVFEGDSKGGVSNEKMRELAQEILGRLGYDDTLTVRRTGNGGRMYAGTNRDTGDMTIDLFQYDKTPYSEERIRSTLNHELIHWLTQNPESPMPEEDVEWLRAAPDPGSFTASMPWNPSGDQEKMARNFEYWARRGMAGYGTPEHTMFPPAKAIMMFDPNKPREEMYNEQAVRREWNRIIDEKYNEDDPAVLEQGRIFQQILDGAY